MSASPVRTCVGCGRRAPQATLVRFVSVEGVLTAGRRLPGRGAYTCDRPRCFADAVERRRFPRALRSRVEIDRALVRLYTEQPNG